MNIKAISCTAFAAIIGCTFSSGSLGWMGEPVPPKVAAQKLKERESSFAEKVMDTPLYSVWLAKTAIKDGSNPCITNFSNFLVDPSKAPPVLTPKNLDELMNADGQKLVLQYQKDQVTAAAETNAMIKGMLNALSKKGSKELSAMEWNMLFTQVEASFTLAQRVAYLRKQQEAELVASGGVKNRQWVSLEGRIKKAPLEEELRNASRTLPQKDYNTKEAEFLSQKRGIDAWVEQEFKVVEQNSRRQSGRGREASPYLDVHVLHKVTGFDTPVVPMRNGQIEPAYLQQLLSLVAAVGQRCGDIQYIVLNHQFEKMITYGGLFGQTMFVKRDGQWRQEFVDNDFAGGMGRLGPDRSPLADMGMTMSAMGERVSSLWDRRDFHPWYSPYEVSLMAEDSEKLVLPAKLRAPDSNEIRLVILRTHQRAGTAANPLTSTMSESWFGSGSLSVKLEKVNVKSCSPDGRAFRCTYQLDSRMSFSGGGMAVISAAMLQRSAGSATPLNSEEFTYKFEMTERGWDSEEMAQYIERKREESKDDIKRGIAKGAKAGSCGVTLLGPRSLVPMECR